MKIKNLPKIDRPREKLKAKGASALSDFELLLALFGSGNKQVDVTQISREVLKLLKNNGVNISYKNLEEIKGLGSAKISELLAAFEISKRYLIQPDQPILNNVDDVANYLKDLRDKKQEYFVCLTLDGANRLISRRTITIGTLNSSLIHPREVFADAVSDRAANIIICHNHSSGILRPSENDIEITQRLLKSGKLLGIHVLDHVILTKNGHFSFADKGLINKMDY